MMKNVNFRGAIKHGRMQKTKTKQNKNKKEEEEENTCLEITIKKKKKKNILTATIDVCCSLGYSRN